MVRNKIRCPKELVAYDPCSHQDMTLQRQRSRHPRASSPLDTQRRRMPISTTPSEDFISPQHITPGLRARGIIYSIFFIMNFLSAHVFKRAFAYFFSLSFRLPGGFSPFRDPIREALSLCEPLIFYEHVLVWVVGLKWALSSIGLLWAL